MSIRHISRSVLVSGSLLIVIGCGRPDSKPATPPKQAPSITDASKSDGNHAHDDATHAHSHERGKMLIADAGPYHALLTAHLSKAGNELDIFFETPVTKDPQPVAIAIESFEAQATSGEGESQALKFEPAPADERPQGEKPGTYSHFVAKAPWMKPEQELLVVAKFTVDGKEITARWKEFSSKKYAHHVE